MGIGRTPLTHTRSRTYPSERSLERYHAGPTERETEGTEREDERVLVPAVRHHEAVREVDQHRRHSHVDGEQGRDGASEQADQKEYPADQFEAFDNMIGEGRSEDEIALKFGVSVDLVRRRLKIARVAPEIIEQFRAGDLTLECVNAFESQVRPSSAARAMTVSCSAPTVVESPWPVCTTVSGGSDSSFEMIDRRMVGSSL